MRQQYECDQNALLNLRHNIALWDRELKLAMGEIEEGRLKSAFKSHQLIELEKRAAKLTMWLAEASNRVEPIGIRIEAYLHREAEITNTDHA